MLNIEAPTNESDFYAMMEAVDLFLKQKDVPPHARPFQGSFEISKALNLELNMVPVTKAEPKSGSYAGDDLTIRIFRWFDERYGNKLAIRIGPGRIVILIRDDPWEVHLPKVWGTVQFFVSLSEKSSNQDKDLQLRRIPRHNILDSIEDLPIGLAKSLDVRELSAIADIFLAAYSSMVAIDGIIEFPMIRELISDIDASVSHFLSVPPHFGLSKWASLQATEKALKAYVSAKGESFPWRHNLEELSTLATEFGLQPIPSKTLNDIQCTASVRYGEGADVTKIEAYIAHLLSISVCGLVAEQIASIEN